LAHGHYCFFLYFFTLFLGFFDRGKREEKERRESYHRSQGKEGESEGEEREKKQKKTVSAFAFLRYSALLHSALPPCSVLFCRGVYGEICWRERERVSEVGA